MKALKLRQVFDAIFGVHDNDRVDLARRVRDAQSALDAEQSKMESLRDFVEQQEPMALDALEEETHEIEVLLDDVVRALDELSVRARSASHFADKLRRRHSSLATLATASFARVRDRDSLLDRFASLRAQYADDVRKFTLMVEAESIFDALSVSVCPVCFHSLPVQAVSTDGTCSLCHHPVGQGSAGVSGYDQTVEATALLASRELRAAKRRYRELDEYWQRLASELPAMRQRAERNMLAEATASRELDEATQQAVNPYLAERGELERARREALVRRTVLENGINLYTGLKAREDSYLMALGQLNALRKEQRDNRERPDRDEVIRRVSRRYDSILQEIKYPKVAEQGVPRPYIDGNLVPYVRGEHYSEASSGGQVLVTLAWALAVFEIAYENQQSHPGFLIIDTPQKNLGGRADDAEFADIRLVERLYAHMESWLSGLGEGAQLIIVDNTPPKAVDGRVIVRFTRDPEQPPFGLIDNETGSELQ